MCGCAISNMNFSKKNLFAAVCCISRSGNHTNNFPFDCLALVARQRQTSNEKDLFHFTTEKFRPYDNHELRISKFHEFFDKKKKKN